MLPRRLRPIAAGAALLLSATLPTSPAFARDEARIVGGSAVSPTAYAASWPWLVVVQIESFASTAECTGSLIAPQWVLTAAHCTLSDGLIPHQYSASQFTVGGGSPDITHAGVLGTVDAVYTDPAYDTSGDINAVGDVGLLHLAAPVPTTRLPLLAPRPPTGAVTATALGWGATVGDGDASPTLRAVQVSAVPKGPGTLYNPGPNGTCFGDSGGPLVTGSIIIGTTSYGDDSCTTDNYYAETSSVVPWILQTAASEPGALPTVATAPVFSGPRTVQVRANTGAVSITVPTPRASGAAVTCNRPATRRVKVPSRTVTTCTAVSAGGTSRTSYTVVARRAAHAVRVRAAVRRGAGVTLVGSGFAPHAAVTLTWRALRRTVHASLHGKVTIRMRAPRSTGKSTVTLTSSGTTTQIRAQLVRIRR